MTRILAAAVLAAMSGGALASSFDGRWAFDPEDCDLAEPGDRVPVEISGDKIDYYESSCTILSETPYGTQGLLFRVELTCRGEGETWTGTNLIALAPDEQNNPRYLIEMDTADGSVVLRHHCP